jgi:hypothetical protein
MSLTLKALFLEEAPLSFRVVHEKYLVLGTFREPVKVILFLKNFERITSTSGYTEAEGTSLGDPCLVI